MRGLSTTMPSKPPVMLAFWKISELNTSASARVTTARVTPRVRMAGRATTTPTATAAATPMRMAGTKPRSKLLAERAATQAPKPARANWHSDSWPA